MAKRLWLTAVALICLALPLSALAANCQELVAQGDQLYQQREDPAKAQAAAKAYGDALAADAKCYDAAWKLSKTMYWIGKQAEKDAKLDLFQKGVDSAKQAIGINPKGVEGHYWLGVNYGVYGNAKGITSSLSLVEPIKEEMAEVIKINPDFDAGGPYRVLGRLYFKLPGIMGGDNDLSMKNLETAVQKGPQRWLNHVYLAEVYIDEGKDAEAKVLLDKVIAGPPESGLEPEYKEWKAEAEKLLKDM